MAIISTANVRMVAAIASMEKAKIHRKANRGDAYQIEYDQDKHRECTGIAPPLSPRASRATLDDQLEIQFTYS